MLVSSRFRPGVEDAQDQKLQISLEIEENPQQSDYFFIIIYIFFFFIYLGNLRTFSP